MNTNTVIELSGVDVAHFDVSERLVVKDVNWRIDRGEFWVVGGASSSGKSSLLLTAAGLNRPAGGALRIFGTDLAEAKEKDQIGWRRRIGFVFEFGGRLFNHLTVSENIGLPLRYQLNVAEEHVAAKVDDLLTRTELQAYAHSLPSRLSLGVQQRVALARALTGMEPTAYPEVLFLDNPLSTLSLRDCRWWLDFLRQLRESQAIGGGTITIIASADDFRGWIDLASHFATVESGHFKVIGGREQVIVSREPIVREFLGAES